MNKFEKYGMGFLVTIGGFIVAMAAIASFAAIIAGLDYLIDVPNNVEQWIAGILFFGLLAGLLVIGIHDGGEWWERRKRLRQQRKDYPEFYK